MSSRYFAGHQRDSARWVIGDTDDVNNEFHDGKHLFVACISHPNQTPVHRFDQYESNCARRPMRCPPCTIFTPAFCIAGSLWRQTAGSTKSASPEAAVWSARPTRLSQRRTLWQSIGLHCCRVSVSFSRKSYLTYNAGDVRGIVRP